MVWYYILQCTWQFKERYERLSGESASSGPQKKDRGSRSRFRTLLHELDSSDDDELSDDTPGTSTTFIDATPAWSKDFNTYLNTTDEIPEGQTIVQWWGVSLFKFLHQNFHIAHCSMNRSTLIDIQYGHHLRGTISQSWHHLYPANGHSPPQASQFRSAATVSRGILSKHFSA
jgi:hypothetical protein